MITRRRYMGNHDTTDIYQTYDYLEAGANLPYINTLYYPSTNASVGFSAYVPNSGGKGGVYFGARNATNNRQFCLLTIAEANNFRLDINNTQYTAGFRRYNTKLSMVLNTDYLVVNNTILITCEALSSVPSYPLFLFNMNNAGSSASTSAEGMRLYTMTFYDDNGLGREFVPCQLLQDTTQTWDGETHYAGECGMWDSVTDLFYGNANSTGSFSVGND